MSIDGTYTGNEGKKLTKSSSQKEMKPKKQPPPKRNLAPVSKLRLTSDSRLSRMWWYRRRCVATVVISPCIDLPL